ncbi:hypothetical protein [Mitsuaria sp. GD03876]|uniref:hypothetical protein n=1 Tax=Mitsuaria sp. GD03876 TaxID=2975399 RepID=UPI00244A9A41|nr:hypothetical protein [Mitsuaria sp. GD03876]MDH0863877.1 hypothetical protein [Mitsuaria sp. GD03876]
MNTIDRLPLKRALRGTAKLALALSLAACGTPTQRPAPPAPAPTREITATPTSPAAPVPTSPAVRRGLPLPAPHAVASHEDLRRQAAQRMVAANPDTTYMSEPPPELLAIPVLEVELNQDGTIKHIRVLRKPTQAEDTIELAIAAVRRAAPFGDVSRLPKPWKFVEVFLFDDDRRFKPRTLDD